uniref:Krueppel-like factor 12 n=1 Tax=Diabrotica virgifera virgifera TaxID=50390 RepID=A0A6P7GDH5_DIAVI
MATEENTSECSLLDPFVPLEDMESVCLEDNDNFLDSMINELLFKNDDQLLEEAIAGESFSLSLFDDVNDVLPRPLEISMENDTSEPLGISEMSPHMINENTCKKTPKDPRSEGKHFVQSPHALITHDHTQKRIEKFPCPKCEKVYQTAYPLKAHLRRHSGEKPFICNWLNCTWRFARSDELARHKDSHSGVKPYKCEFCEKAFVRSDHLSRHKKVHMKHMSQYGTYDIRKRAK